MIVKTKLSDNIHTIIINPLETVRKTTDIILCFKYKKIRLFFQRVKNVLFTAPFNNTRALKLKTQPGNAFFATVNQIFGSYFQLSTTAEQCFVV